MLTSLAFALLLLAAQDAPVSTSPAAAPAQPPPPAVAPPAPVTGDYEYVAQCFGSLSGYLAAREKALPEVERIERDWAGRLGPTTAEQAMAEYRTIIVEAESHQETLRRALGAAQGASPADLLMRGQAATADARGKWNMADARALAREWMSWSLPDRCLREASVLEQRSTLNTALLRAPPAPVAAATPVQPAPAQTEPASEPAPAATAAEPPAQPAQDPAADPTTADPG